MTRRISSTAAASSASIDGHHATSPEGRGMQLSAINPVTVLGPVLGDDYSHPSA